MRTYPKEYKDQLIAKMLPPQNCSVTELAKETGIPKETLYTWRGKHRHNNPETRSNGTKNFTSTEKFKLVLESAALNEQEKGEFCRRNGVFPEQLSAWRTACEDANEHLPRREEQAKLKGAIRQNKILESELRRKDKALAEAAALLILQKKVQEIWMEDEDKKLNCRSGK